MPNSPPAADDGTRTRTQAGDGTWSRAGHVLLPALTVLYHRNPARIGDRMALDGIESGREFLLSRNQGDYAPPGSSGAAKPLDDPWLSRTPLRLVGGDRKSGDQGAIQLHITPSPTRVMVDGTPLANQVTISTRQIDEGTVIVLAGQVVLLLHRYDPLAHRPGPQWGLVGDSAAMHRVRSDVRRLADLDVPVLIRGESGTGKELVAQALHRAGPRRNRPFVAVNMAAIPPSLAAAELFGAARGAYSGADRKRAGYFRRAEGGTLFLDEIGETSPEVQTLLLRVLESGEIQSVGGGASERVDVRVISATDADLERGIADESFRGPLFHRLSGYPIHLPPLRQRRDDFGRLLAHFLARELEAIDRADRLEARDQPWLPAPLVAHLARQRWPGNVRQLSNVIRQLVIANRDVDPAEHFAVIDHLLGERSSEPPASDILPATSTPPTATPSQPRRPSDITEAELLATLRAHRFRPASAADALGIPRSSIYDLIERSPSVRKASELTEPDIEAVREAAAGSVERAAELLEVSAQALRRQLGRLGQVI